MTVADNLAFIRADIAKAARAAGRAASSVELVAISKTFGADVVSEAIIAGQRVFGENRVQEAGGKWPALTAAMPGIELHLVGGLQSNKAAAAIELFDVIHSLDRASLARELAKAIARSARPAPRLFVQVNTGAEPQKGGVLPQEADAFVDLCREELKLPVVGLMCIPPVEDVAAPHFALLTKIAGRLGLSQLSMGMSADYATAIAFGATHVRIGSAIFGQR